MTTSNYTGWEKYKFRGQYLGYIAKIKICSNETQQNFENKLFETNTAWFSPLLRLIFHTPRLKIINKCSKFTSVSSLKIAKKNLFLAIFLLFLSAEFVYGQENAESYRKFLNTSGRPQLNMISSNYNITAISEKDRIDNSPPLNEFKLQNEVNRNIKTSAQSVSINRNVFLNFDNMLQRQLREKARLDSLESIKMHILMRLNLKQLPNITKPIPVPQNIIDNFYKDYNLSTKSVLSNRALNSDVRRKASEILSQNASQIRSANTDDIKDNESSQMQGDDAYTANQFPNIYKRESNENLDTKRKIQIYSINDDYEGILSHITNIYIFPEQIHHYTESNLKIEVLRFKIANDYSELSYATLHIYVRGWDWIWVQKPELIEEIKNQQNKDIIVSIHRAERKAANCTHKMKMFEFRQSIPLGQGEWVNIDVKPLFGDDLSIKTQELQISGLKSWMNPLIVTTDTASKNRLTVHIEIGSIKKHRRKRSVYMDCTENDHDLRCCRYPLKVNFTSFGWHFVVAPTSFDAYFCSGDCRVGYLEHYPHTHLAALTTSATPCCSPTKMSSLSLLYFDDNHNLVLSVIPNMSVEGCSCS
ncbi:uncharacterized protein myo [Drosophila bipectinata]|uniref:uncharacterized protein myo n=1 Tax=Drosophila bipectinata TaxID=42026 RepID=UPI001C89868F|nr:uncharacterized protein LOC108127096 [Drosophila bipectinata]